MHNFPESDWRILRELSRVALERFCQRILQEAAHLVNGIEGNTRDFHDRYLSLFKLLHERDDEMAEAFNDLRRSHAIWQLTAMWKLKLLTEGELARFSDATRTAATFE
jgi:hypothetical protein